MVVRRVVDDLQKRLAEPVRRAVTGSLSRATRNRRPRLAEIDWHRTIRANLHHYDPGSGTVVPETLIGHGRRRSSLRDVILCIDQSGSMATSVVYSSVFGAVLASLRAITTRMIVFDTAVVDLTDELHDPVDLLFGTQLGGGTDINRALAYCQTQISRPAQTVLVLVTDLYEGGNADEMIRRAAAIVASGVRVVCLLALNDTGAPVYDARHAAQLAALGVPTFACTPDRFPDLMAVALQKQDVGSWASREGITLARPAL
jgi:Mg-chelatase subunit ChlD